MSQVAALDEDHAGDVTTDDLTLDFHTWGLAGCIDRLTVPLRQQGVRVRFETPHHGVEIPAACAALLYRAGQEMLSNALRHSSATEVTVRLEAVYHGIRLIITDDGIGYSPESQTPASTHHGYGVCLMTMAVHEAHGTVGIESAPGRGTRVSVTLPLD
ncbi:sensor histidine kinase [Arthrobacter sp. Soil762]|uniref:sensor histidine kinase n=1 Tax=Arthrobacter sp. Soil762 TaxID=1736401 RepID=UPI0006FA322A|nr:ATP-binding protein [Arthrobacter sp. Soil762]KRE74591.1 histidine kinase [Arthrobacter sp. Soil762]